MALGFLMLLVMAIPTTSATIYECDSCSDCDTKLDSASFGDIVQLNQSISTAGANCIHTETGVDNVVLDCQGYTISGNFTSVGIRLGEYPNFSTNITIKNCRVTQFDTGIFLRSTGSNVIDNVTIYNNDYDGLSFYQSGNDIVTNLNVSYNGQDGITSIQNNAVITDFVSHDNGRNGIRLQSSNYFFKNGNVYNNLDGIYLYSVGGDGANIIQNISIHGNTDDGLQFQRWGRNNIINDSLIYDNDGYGLNFIKDNVYASYNNLIYNNVINNTNNFYSNSGDNWNRYNYTNETIPGTNIIGGNLIGGNFWTNPTDTEYSDNCTDNDYDGICDNAYTLDTWNIDYYPLTEVHVFFCNNCSDCQTKIDNALPGDEVRLTADITNQDGDCIKFNTGKSNITFDCQGHLIDGDGDSNGYGIYLNRNNDYNVIKNCSIQQFQYGYYSFDYYDYSDYNTIMDIDITDCDIGVYARGTKYRNNQFININSSYTNTGFYLWDFAPGRNYFYNCTSIGNSNALGTHDSTVSTSWYNAYFEGTGTGTGFASSTGDSAYFYNATIKNFERGISFSTNADNNRFYDSYIIDNDYGVYVHSGNPSYQCNGEYFINNVFDNTVNTWTDETWHTGWIWNGTYNCSQPSIIGGCYGGNRWNNYIGFDPDEDGVGNTPHSLGNLGTDYLPLVETVTCNSCSDCNTKISNAFSSDTIKLSQNINSSSTCIDIGNSNINLNCNNYDIYSSSSSYPNVAMNIQQDISGVDIRNCDISGGYTNIWININADNIDFYDNDIHDNLGSASCIRYKYNINGGRLEGNEIYNCNNQGINIDSSGAVLDLVVYDNYIHDTNIGIVAMNDANISYNTIDSNTQGIDLRGTDDAEIYSNYITDNTYGLYFQDDYFSNLLIYNNYIENTNNFWVNSPTGSGNALNIAKTNGTNIIGGAYMGGNFWDDYTGYDLDGDGLGEASYLVYSGLFLDSLPLTNILENTPPNITIIEPEYDIAYQIVNVTLNVTDEISGVGGCVYNVDGGTNETYDFNGTNTLEDLDVRLHSLNVYCWDNENFTGYETVTFGYGYFVEVCDPNMISLCEPFDQWTEAYCLDDNTLRKKKICTIQWVENETMMYCNWEKYEDVTCDNGCYEGLSAIGSGCAPTDLEIVGMTGGFFLIFVILSILVMGHKKRKRR